LSWIHGSSLSFPPPTPTFFLLTIVLYTSSQISLTSCLLLRTLKILLLLISMHVTPVALLHHTTYYSHCISYQVHLWPLHMCRPLQ
jgi:hypothetical protein